MGTTANKLNKLKQTKAAIKQAIVNKGVAVSDSDAFSTYPEKINSIVTESREDNYKYMLERKFPLNTTYKVGDDITTYLPYSSLRGCQNIDVLDLNKVGSLSNYCCSDMPQLKKVVGMNLTGMGFQCLGNNPMLEEVVLPQVDTVDYYGGASWFSNDDKLTKVTLKSFAPSICNYCFNECGSLDISKLDLTNTVKIEDSAFSLWVNKEKVEVPYEINLPNIEIIEGYVFRNRIKLKNITFGEKLKSIGSNAFYGCTLLESINLGSAITEIGSGAFSECTSLKTIIINKPKDSIANAPWGAPRSTQVIWNG